MRPMNLKVISATKSKCESSVETSIEKFYILPIFTFEPLRTLCIFLIISQSLALMAEPTSVQDIFAEIENRGKKSRVEYESVQVVDAFIEKELEKARHIYTFMKDATVLDYSDYINTLFAQKKRNAMMLPLPTTEQLWEAAYNYDPLSTPPGTESDLQKILSDKRLGSVPLGRLWGEFKLELIPEIGALPTTEDTEGLTAFSYAATDSGAIIYEDGHPSDFEAPGLKVNPPEDDKLRRFASLGWIILVQPDRSWSRTGHVLVIDMDERRNRHPWIVLASHWPHEFEDADGGFTDYAEKRVLRDDSTQPGVLPGGHNRTSIGRIDPVDKSSEAPVLKQFGPDFAFSVVELGGERSHDRDPEWGPDLAHVMEWYWDPNAEEEVCYSENRKEYMRYDRQTKQYTYPSLPDQRNILD